MRIVYIKRYAVFKIDAIWYTLSIYFDMLYVGIKIN